MDRVDSETRALIRLQVLTPLSTLISLAAQLVAAFAIRPSLGAINDDYLTILTPRKSFIGAYWLVLYLLQSARLALNPWRRTDICAFKVGYCVLLAVVRKEQTKVSALRNAPELPQSCWNKATLVNAVGLRFVFSNVCMAFWTLFFEFRLFLASEICLLIALVLLASIWGQLLLYPASRARPLELALIHAPVRLFLVMLLIVHVWSVQLSISHLVSVDGRERQAKWTPGLSVVQVRGRRTSLARSAWKMVI
jgi:hypothetical protein